MEKPIAMVIPWYGENIRGGAEKECNYIAHMLKRVGWNVEVFTTCVKDAASDRGKNTLRAGKYIENDILVRRFKVRVRDSRRYNSVNIKIYNNIPVTYEEEEIYYKEDINSPSMYRYINKHSKDYSLFIFEPYMYGITFYGSLYCPHNCVMIPCLHDESYAYLKHTREMIERFKGIIFHAKPEMELAEKLYDLTNIKKGILGGGIDTDWAESCKPETFRKKFKINDDFLLYAGRKDSGKKVDELISYFIRFKKNTNCSLKLVLIGGGHIDIPDNYNDEIIDLGFVSEEDKRNAYAAAFCFCNPSYFESFSIVIMESWIAGRPVLVSEHCDVTKNYCIESNGGLYYSEFNIFSECLKFMLDNRDIADKMGEKGHDYVLQNFTHNIMAKKYSTFLSDLLMH